MSTDLRGKIVKLLIVEFRKALVRYDGYVNIRCRDVADKVLAMFEAEQGETSIPVFIAPHDNFDSGAFTVSLKDIWFGRGVKGRLILQKAKPDAEPDEPKKDSLQDNAEMLDRLRMLSGVACGFEGVTYYKPAAQWALSRLEACGGIPRPKVKKQVGGWLWYSGVLGELVLCGREEHDEMRRNGSDGSIFIREINEEVEEES